MAVAAERLTEEDNEKTRENDSIIDYPSGALHHLS